jgi:ABC-type phosphate transport system ATPase subunit
MLSIFSPAFFFGELAMHGQAGNIFMKPTRQETEDDMTGMFRFSNKDNKELT